ncbi:transcription antitermination factor NusB [Deinococcus maricopensis]|uniref:Transcription antitermination protein NusB n=1 Tax=Deinococcus maricopensis (strain DSM 21211 / LMG 22137 / NRRL B-23946 / LB-34) TaxID=709986 RepID=E8U952_DEIML|nr:transcription antitermination factor NusB [Deinococcus maricopensis]ADV67591.1 NusB antitermination factor [Deinococcus maricopensis DSM 21211]
MTRRREKASAPSNSRRAAREFAFRVLFESERGQVPLQEALNRARLNMAHGDDTYPELGDEAVDFARDLLGAQTARRAEVDSLLTRTIRGWTFEQMAQTDLNVLRLATAEMLRGEDPHPPIIESFVRVARKFGGEDSGRFVNGVLSGVSRTIEEQGALPLPGPDGSGDDA